MKNTVETSRGPRLPSSSIHKKLLKIGWSEIDINNNYARVAQEVEFTLRDFVISPPLVDPLEDVFLFTSAPAKRIPVELVEEMIFGSFASPIVRSQVVRKITTQKDRFVGHSAKGPLCRLDVRRTAIKAIAKGRGVDFSMPEFRTYETESDTQVNVSTGALILIAKDVGYGNNKRESAAKSISFWMPRFFKKFYDEVEIRYLLQRVDDIASTPWGHMRDIAMTTEGNKQPGFTSNVQLYRKLNEVFVPAFEGFDPYLFHLYSSDSTRSDDKIAFDNARKFIQFNGTIFFGDFRQDKYRPSTFRDEIARLRPLDQARTVVLEPGSDILADMFKVWFASVYEPPAYSTVDTY